jgi:hypothetical protein
MLGRLLQRLGRVFDNRTQYTRALEMDKETLRINKGAMGEDHPFGAATLNNISLLS